MSSEFRKGVLSGLRWSSLATFSISSLAFVVSVVLSRILEPHVFGVVAMFTLARSLCEVVAAKTLGEALVFYREADERDRSATFWIATGVGGFLTIALILSAPWIAAAFHEPDLANLVRFGAVVCLLNGAAVVPDAMLRRDLKFGEYSKTQMTAAFVGAGISVAGALNGFGAYALVFGELVQKVIELASRIKVLRFRPVWVLWTPRMPGIVRYSRNLLATSTFTFLGLQSDRAVMGRVFGAEQLGYYQRAYGLPAALSGPFMQIIESVLLPTLMQVKDDTKRLKNLCLRAIDISAFVFAPAFAGMAAVAQPLVLTLFGPKWLETVPLLQVTAFAMLTQSVGRPLFWLYRVAGRTGDLARWTIAAGSFYSAAVLLASFFGSVRAVALAMLIVSLILFVPRCVFAGRIVGIGPVDVFGRLWGTALATLAMLGGVALAARAPGWAGIKLPALGQLIAEVVCGGIAYVSAAAMLRLPALQEARSILVSRRLRPEARAAGG